MYWPLGYVEKSTSTLKLKEISKARIGTSRNNSPDLNHFGCTLSILPIFEVGTAGRRTLLSANSELREGGRGRKSSDEYARIVRHIICVGR